MNKKTCIWILITSLIVLLLLSTTAGAVEQVNHSSALPFELVDEYNTPLYGTIPLPPEKELAYPPPNGLSTITVDYPSEVEVGEQFYIGITYQTNANPYSAFVLYTQLYIPSGSNLPTNWRQISISPWAPEDNRDVSGTVETLPSIDWVTQNWSNWYGVGVAPYNSGNLLIACSQGWAMGHYFMAIYGDHVTVIFGPFSFSAAGTYTFELMPTGWYFDAQGITGDLEPISFEVTAQAGGIEANVDIKPDSLNLKSHRRFVTAYIEGTNFDVQDIVISSIKLNEAISAKTKPTKINDYNNNGIPDLMVKFPYQPLQNMLSDYQGNNVILKVSGQTSSGQSFEATDTVRLVP